MSAGTRQDHREPDSLAAYTQAIVDAAPPLEPAQVAELRTLVRPVLTNTSAAAGTSAA